MFLLIVTGMSGAGKSQALHKLEDMGFFCVDNLPAALIGHFADLCLSKKDLVAKAAVGVDCREEMSLGQIYEKIDELKAKDIDTSIMFIDAADEVLIRRYKESRRNHPLSREGFVEHGIEVERRAMSRLKSMADYIINTSQLKPIELFEKIDGFFGGHKKFSVFVESFGYKNGTPPDADFVFDLRFLPNPFWIEGLRGLSGLDKPVAEYVMGFKVAKEFLNDVAQMMAKLMPAFEREGRMQVVIALGCTGGRHRSVCIAAELAKMLNSTIDSIKLSHRDIDKDSELHSH